jgi:hypothetical protein
VVAKTNGNPEFPLSRQTGHELARSLLMRGQGQGGEPNWDNSIVSKNDSLVNQVTDRPDKKKAERRILASGKAKRMWLDDSQDLKDRQSSKIKELSDALVAAGFCSLDGQANALGLSRSTTWTILKGKHKNYGLSAALINRILQQPRLNRRVRAKILEYVREKAAGRYGHNQTQLRRFNHHLSAQAETTGVHNMLALFNTGRKKADTNLSKADRSNDLET